MAKAALKRESDKTITMPPSMANAEGSLKLTTKSHKERGETKSTSNCSC